MKPLIIDLPIDTKSEANLREHWGRKHKRVRKQRTDAYYFCYHQAGYVDPKLYKKIIIELVRMAPMKLDSDNLCSSLKAVRDGIADWLKIDDGSESLEWNYSQERIDKIRRVVAKVTFILNDEGV